MKRKFALPIVLLLLSAVIGCPTPPPTLPPPTTGGGFSLHTSLIVDGIPETAAGSSSTVNGNTICRELPVMPQRGIGSQTSSESL
jgi:hypothetical protein